MDWADDITYAIHDLLDFYRAGLIPLELVHRNGETPASIECARFLDRVFLRKPAWAGRRGTYEAALERILENLPFEASHRYTGGEADEQTLYQFATKLISRYVNSIAPSSGENGAVVTIDSHARDEVDVLKQFVWEYVILNPDIAQLQVGQRLAVRVAFENGLRAARDREAHFFPEPYRSRLADCSSDAGVVRLAADYVAGMSERELMNTFRRLQGILGN